MLKSLKKREQSQGDGEEEDTRQEKDRDQENPEQKQPAGHLLQAPRRAVQEGQRALHPQRRRDCHRSPLARKTRLLLRTPLGGCRRRPLPLRLRRGGGVWRPRLVHGEPARLQPALLRSVPGAGGGEEAEGGDRGGEEYGGRLRRGGNVVGRGGGRHGARRVGAVLGSSGGADEERDYESGRSDAHSEFEHPAGGGGVVDTAQPGNGGELRYEPESDGRRWL